MVQMYYVDCSCKQYTISERKLQDFASGDFGGEESEVVVNTSQQMEICTAFFTLNIVCCNEMSQCVEVMSNLRVRKNLGEDSTHGLSALTFVRTFSSFTSMSKQ